MTQELMHSDEELLAPPVPRVLILVGRSDSATLQRIKRQVNELLAKGYQISIVCSLQREERGLLDLPAGVLAYRYPSFSGWGVWGGLFSCLCQFLLTMWVLIGEGFDAIHAITPPEGVFLIGGIFKFLFETKFLLDCRILVPEFYESRHKGRGLPYWFLVGMEKLAFRSADIVLVPNESYRKVVMSRGDKPSDKIFIVGDSPDLEKSAIALPLGGGGAGKKYLIGCSSIMEKQDGVPYLVEAMRHIVHDLKRTDVQFALAGHGRALQYLQEVATQKQVTDYVTVAESSSLSAADICVCPNEVNSINDKSTVRQIADYMALGKPIVQFECTEGRFTAGNASLYAAANDSFDFAAKIIELIDDPQKRASMGAFGRTRAERVLAWSYEAPRFRAAYDTLFTIGHTMQTHFLL